MSKKIIVPTILTIILVSAVLIYNQGYLDPFLGPIEQEDSSVDPELSPANGTITIAAFNIQILGKTKREKTAVMDVLARTVREFDVVLIQEIRDVSRAHDVDTKTMTDWTYDRIVMLDTTYSGEYVMDSTSVYFFNDVYGLNQTFTEEVSDHFPVFAEFRVDGSDDD